MADTQDDLITVQKVLDLDDSPTPSQDRTGDADQAETAVAEKGTPDADQTTTPPDATEEDEDFYYYGPREIIVLTEEEARSILRNQSTPVNLEPRFVKRARDGNLRILNGLVEQAAEVFRIIMGRDRTPSVSDVSSTLEQWNTDTEMEENSDEEESEEDSDDEDSNQN